MTVLAPAPAAPGGAAEAARGSRPAAVLVVVCLALATVVAANASLNVALPGIARATHASQTRLEWVIDAYSLVFAALLLPAGALGDRYGRRRALLAGLAIFGAGSAAAMTVSGAGTLIALRGVLGIGAALVMPATLSTITGTFPEAQRPRAVAVWAGVAGGSAVLGLMTSGLLLTTWSWRSVFGLNVVLAALAAVGTVRVVPESADPDSPRIDVGGALIAVVGLGTLIFSVIEAPDAGWLSVRSLAGLACGVGILGGFVAWELRQTAPLLDPRLFLDRAFSAGSLTVLLQFFAFFGFVFTMLQYLQVVRGDSPLVAAVSVLPMAAAMMPLTRLTPLIAARVGTRWTCVTGLLVMAMGLGELSTIDAGSHYRWILLGLVLLGAGTGAAMAPATTAITEALPAAQQGIGSAMNDLCRELGGALGIAVLGSLLTASYRSHLVVTGLPPGVASRARSSVAVASRLGGQVQIHAQSAFAHGMHVALLGGAGVLSIAAVVVAVLLSKRGHAQAVREPLPTSPNSVAPRSSAAASSWTGSSAR